MDRGRAGHRAGARHDWRVELRERRVRHHWGGDYRGAGAAREPSQEATSEAPPPQAPQTSPEEAPEAKAAQAEASPPQAQVDPTACFELRPQLQGCVPRS